MLYIRTMSTEKGSKINQLLQAQPKGAVLLSSWMESQGYSLDLQKRYRNSHWLTSLGTGAMIRAQDNVGYEGAIYALQTQAGSSIHPGGKTALSLLGKSHYLELATKKVILFGGKSERLPSWFKNHDWKVKVEFHPSSFLPDDLGLTKIQIGNLELKVSSAPRALMECLYLAPEKQELLECCELFEGLNNLRPNSVQQLIEQCGSVKVKRLFLYMAEKFSHEWVNHLNLEKIDLGTGKRSLVKNGTYIPKYQITVPKEVATYGS